MMFLLPLLFAGADPQIVATGDPARIEQALSDGVRARVAAGWEVIDLRSEQDDYIITIQKGDAVEKHVLHPNATKHEYRVQRVAAPPASLHGPTDFVRAALAAPRGGIEVEASCGGYYEKPYIIDDEASGEFATSLVARALATSHDVLAAYQHANNTIVFSLDDKRGVTRNLVIRLDPKGNVIEAQLRRFEYIVSEAAPAKYTRLAELKRATRKTRVLSIATQKGSLALVTPRGWFIIDPHGSAFGRDDEYECGC